MKILGFRPVMPSFLNGRKQLTTVEANTTRCVTKNRWVIESGKRWAESWWIPQLILLVNGKIKQWRYFNQVIPNSSIRFVEDDLSITCAMINAYSSPCTLNIDYGEDVANQMLERLDRDNVFEKWLTDLEEQRLLKWNKCESIYCIFPSLTLDDVEKITFGMILNLFWSSNMSHASRFISNPSCKVLHSRPSSTCLLQRWRFSLSCRNTWRIWGFGSRSIPVATCCSSNIHLYYSICRWWCGKSHQGMVLLLHHWSPCCRMLFPYLCSSFASWSRPKHHFYPFPSAYGISVSTIGTRQRSCIFFGLWRRLRSGFEWWQPHQIHFERWQRSGIQQRFRLTEHFPQFTHSHQLIT